MAISTSTYLFLYTMVIREVLSPVDSVRARLSIYLQHTYPCTIYKAKPILKEQYYDLKQFDTIRTILGAAQIRRAMYQYVYTSIPTFIILNSIGIACTYELRLSEASSYYNKHNFTVEPYGTYLLYRYILVP